MDEKQATTTNEIVKAAMQKIADGLAKEKTIVTAANNVEKSKKLLKLIECSIESSSIDLETHAGQQ